MMALERVEDLRTVERAIREEWPIEPAERAALLKRVLTLSKPKDDGTEARPRIQFQALKVMVAATSVNIRRDAVEIQRAQLEHRMMMDGSAQQPDGIDRDVIAEACRRAEQRIAERATRGLAGPDL